MIAGKGHEQGQEFAGGRKEPFDDVEVARDGAARGRAGQRERAMRHWTDQRIAGAAGAELAARAATAPPRARRAS